MPRPIRITVKMSVVGDHLGFCLGINAALALLFKCDFQNLKKGFINQSGVPEGMAAKKSTKKAPKDSSKDEQIGFHKGSLMTLSKERAELARMLSIVEQLMQMHGAALNELGVKLDDIEGAPQKEEVQQPRKKPPIEDLL
ncbi:hypothetical protein GOV11_02970 [Candidatus Woesearchaeota archaeon]|nr:hypothetical protein [Candidatus Woesearchaeota archaeon]